MDKDLKLIILNETNKSAELRKINQEKFIGLTYTDGKFSIEYLPETAKETNHHDRIFILSDEKSVVPISLSKIEKIVLYKDGERHTEYHNQTANNINYEIKKRNPEIPNNNTVLGSLASYHKKKKENN